MIPRLVSVIIPTYDRPDYLREAVDSVFAQTYPFIEILVIDDGSSAGGARTKSALKPYLSPDSSSPRMPKITYLYQKNCGLISAVNRGLALAQGEYIQRLDDDDRLLPEKIARSVEVFRACPAVGLVATGYYHIDAAGKRIHTFPPCPCSEPARLLNMLMRCISACAGVMVRSRAHQKVGAYRDIKAQDYEMWIRVAKEFKVETINFPLAEYRRHPGNSTNPQNNQAQIEQDILNFVREGIEATPLDELIPNLRSKAHAYALQLPRFIYKRIANTQGEPHSPKQSWKKDCNSHRMIRCCDSGKGCWRSMKWGLFPSTNTSRHPTESKGKRSSVSTKNANGFRGKGSPRRPRRRLISAGDLGGSARN